MGRPKGGTNAATKTEETDEVKKLKAKVAKLEGEKKNLAEVATEEMLEIIHYRESSGIYAMLEKKAAIENLSVSLWVRKIARAKCGLGSL